MLYTFTELETLLFLIRESWGVFFVELWWSIACLRKKVGCPLQRFSYAAMWIFRGEVEITDVENVPKLPKIRWAGILRLTGRDAGSVASRQQ